MKKILFCGLAVFIVLCFSIPVTAQIYKYTTDDGQTFYTNDPNQVPPEYRNQVEHIYETMPAGGAQNPPPETIGNNNGNDAEPDTSMFVNPELEKRRIQLEGEKTQLEKVYTDLSARRAVLEEERKNLSLDDQDALKVFNDKITQLNTEVESYQTRTNAYNDELRKFNQQVMEQSDKK